VTRASSSPRARAAILARGALALASLGAFVAAGAPACRGLIGADEEEYEQVAEHMCRCWMELPVSFKTKQECQGLISQRLDAASRKATAKWLGSYAENCQSKGCGSVSDCYYMLPVCSFGACSEDAECCGFREGEVCSDAGQCGIPAAGGGGA
jgi:hypothetical protein